MTESRKTMEEQAFVQVRRVDRVGVITLNRPTNLNALSPSMLSELAETLENFDQDQDIRVIILTGSGRAFAAGADIQAMASASPMDIINSGTEVYWKRFRKITKPIIAAVNGFAYGGGCELAMTCDMIVASEQAKFAQPEIKLGIIPGAGGTQRLARAIGPYRAMEMILTGEPISAREAYESGLVNRVVPNERLLDEALSLAQVIASRPPVAVRMARESLRHGVENTMREGLEVERRNFTLLFDTPDQKEGMSAFLEKREPKFQSKGF